MELLWVMYRLFGQYNILIIWMVISRSGSASVYSLAKHPRLVSVSQILLGSAGQG